MSAGTPSGSHPVAPEGVGPLLEATASTLSSAGARTEALAELGRRRRLLGIGGGLSFTPLGRVWRLGVLLLDAEAQLYAVGSVTRAAEERQHGYTAVSASERAALRAVAAQSYPIGEVVNYDAERLQVDPGPGAGLPRPLLLIDGAVQVEWSPGQRPVSLGPYLSERVALLVDPRGS